MQHIIKKQVINLSLDKKLDAFHIQQLVSNYYWNKIVPVLQQAFDAASNEDETISLDTLEIDLGIINVKEIEKGDWEEKVFKKISEQLILVKRGLSFKENVKKKSRVFNISEQWIFYMQHGYLPWNVLKINQDWYKVLESFAADTVAIGNLRNLINNYPDSVRRIVFQNSDSFLKSLIETLTAENQDVLPRLINEIVEIISSSDMMEKYFNSSRKKEVKQKLWQQVLVLAASVKKNLNPSKIAIQLLIKKLSIQQLNTGKVKDFLLKNKIDAASLEKIIKGKDNKPTKLTEVISTKELTGKDNRNEVNEEGIYVLNAGIVLLHPFLFPFFKNLELIKEDSFTDLLSHQKALYLLHYLATGNTKPEEHELVMAKVLCGYALKDPVNNLIELSAEELQESESLLLSAIEQWSILKNTTPDGLREGFLQRNGKLFTKNDILHLQVEQGSIDMLLDHLPWNLSIIKFPWMTEILKVEWR